ncbi:MAG TPA: hypothetical protein VM243_11595, partial [Phycisphaerae bacterium]|nr:hypothetical protein [Phycisphaerae bacterium]
CPACKEWIHGSATKCPHCRAHQPPPASTYAIVAVIVVVIFLMCILSAILSPTSRTSSSYSTTSPYNDYKSTKPVREMDGWERKQIDDAWNSMSPEERRKQIYREFGDIVDIQE